MRGWTLVWASRTIEGTVLLVLVVLVVLVGSVACVRPTGVEPTSTPVVSEVEEPEPEAEPEPEPEAEPEPRGRADWSDDPEVLARLQDAPDSSRRAPPKPLHERTAERLVEDAGVEVLAVHTVWLDEDHGDWVQRVGRADLLVRTPVDTHVVTVARQYQDGSQEARAEVRSLPELRNVQWRGAGVPGPDLVLTVAYDFVWETQCDPGFDRRTDVVICELEGSTLRCARAPVRLRFYDGCGGGESVDHQPDDPEPPCSRVGFSASWSAQPTALRVTLDERDDVKCLDVDSDGQYADPRPPPPPRVLYPTLLDGPYRIEVTTVPMLVGQPDTP